MPLFCPTEQVAFAKSAMSDFTQKGDFSSQVISTTWLLCMGLFSTFLLRPALDGPPHASVTLEILHLALVLFGRSSASECAEVAALAGLGIHLA
jgi:hypothetical protein